MLAARPASSPPDRFFQFSLLGLVATTCIALYSSGYLDRLSVLILTLGILLRAASAAGFRTFPFTPRRISLLVLAGTAIIPFDFYFLSRDLFTSTVQGASFLTAIKVLTARSGRDYIYTAAISLAGLIAAALLSSQPGFIFCLIVYLAFAIAAGTSAEIRGEMQNESQRTISLPGARLPWRLTAVALAGTAGIIAMTAGIFLLVPRTARTAARFLPSSPRLTGFSDHIDLGGLGKIARDNRAVMHIRTAGGTGPLPLNMKWRGAALSRFDGQRWSEPPARFLRPVTAAPGLAVLASRLQLSRRDGSRLLYHVDVRSGDTGTLFVAGTPEFINIDAPLLYLNREAAIHIAPQSRETIRYDVSAHFGPPLPASLTNAERARYLQFPPLDSRIPALAREWADSGSQMARANHIERHLQRDFTYKLDGPIEPVPDPLADFLFVRKEGYCEYFASAMAIMLRTLGIPARVATGFQSGYFNDVSGLNVVRASDAHAWVEAWIEGGPRGATNGGLPANFGEGRWITFDPTPFGVNAAASGFFPRLNMIFDALENTWREWVVSYDINHQLLIASRIEEAIRRVRAPVITARGAIYGLCILVALAALYQTPKLWRVLRRKIRVRTVARKGNPGSEATALYEQMIRRLAKQGVHKPAALTPAEFAVMRPELADFTAVYNLARFGGDPSGTSRLAALLKTSLKDSP